VRYASAKERWLLTSALSLAVAAGISAEIFAGSITVHLEPPSGGSAGGITFRAVKSGSEGDSETYTQVTGEDGSCSFKDLGEGTWTIRAVNRGAYEAIEDCVITLPCVVPLTGGGDDVLMDVDAWPKTRAAKETGEKQTETNRPGKRKRKRRVLKQKRHRQA